MDVKEAAERIHELLEQRDAASFHEAGHAVVRFAVGMSERGTITVTETGEGQVSFGVDEELRGDRSEDRQRLLGHIYTAMGGPLAEERHTGTYNEEGATNDRQHWELCAQELAEDGENGRSVIEHSVRAVQQILERQWPLVERIAAMVLERGAVSTDEIPELSTLHRHHDLPDV